METRHLIGATFPVSLYGPSGIAASSAASSAEEDLAGALAFLRLPRLAFE